MEAQQPAAARSSTSSLVQQQQQQQISAETLVESANKRKRVHKHTVTNPNIDLEVYANNYTGRVKVERLLFIAECCPSLAVDALKLAVDEVKQSEMMDTQKYLTCVNSLNGLLESQSKPQLPVDSKWITRTQKQARDKSELLEHELKTYKNNLIKESIRMGMNDLADHFYQCGDLNSALKLSTQLKEYCTTGKHTLDMNLNIASIALELGSFSFALGFLSKADMSLSSKQANKAELDARIKCESALCLIDCGKFSAAADYLLQLPYISDHRYSKFMSVGDIATYSVLCAIASYDRRTLKQKVVDNTNLRSFLENEPTISELVESFYQCKYGKVSTILARLEEDLYLDMFLHSQLEQIIGQVREHMLINYCLPFQTISIDDMAKHFELDYDRLESVLAKLIVEDKLQALINREKRTLEQKVVSSQQLLYKNAVNVLSTFQQCSKLAIMKTRLIEAELTLNDK